MVRPWLGIVRQPLCCLGNRFSDCDDFANVSDCRWQGNGKSPGSRALGRVTRPVVIIGGSAAAKTACETFQIRGVPVYGVMSNFSKWDTFPNPPVNLGDWKQPENRWLLQSGSVSCFVATGDSEVRKAITEEMQKELVAEHEGSAESKDPNPQPDLHFEACVHPTATVSPSAVVDKGTFVGPSSVVHTCSRLCEGVRLESAVIVEHDTVIGPFVNIGPAAKLCGYIRVGEGAFLGAGCVIAPHVVIGKRATVGCGAVVLQNVPDDAFVAGVPAVIKLRKNGCDIVQGAPNRKPAGA